MPVHVLYCLYVHLYFFIRFLQISENHLYTCSSDKSVRVYDVKVYVCTCTMYYMYVLLHEWLVMCRAVRRLEECVITKDQ